MCVDSIVTLLAAIHLHGPCLGDGCGSSVHLVHCAYLSQSTSDVAPHYDFTLGCVLSQLCFGPYSHEIESFIYMLTRAPYLPLNRRYFMHNHGIVLSCIAALECSSPSSFL